MAEATMEGLLLTYFAAREADRCAQVDRLLGVMTERERRLVREVAVHAYVLGLRAGRAGDEQPPPDSTVTFSTLLGCLAMDDLNPTVARLGRRANRLAARSITESTEETR